MACVVSLSEALPVVAACVTQKFHTFEFYVLACHVGHWHYLSVSAISVHVPVLCQFVV